MKDPDLHKQIKIFCNNGVELIAKAIAGSSADVPTRVAENFVVVDDHTVSQKQSVEIDWSRLVIKREKELELLSSYQNAIKSLENHTTIGPQMNTLIGTGGFMRRMDAKELLRITLTSLLMEKNETLLDESLFNPLYEKIENFLLTDTFHYKYFAPISNFSMDVDEIILGENLRIVKITKEDKEKLWLRKILRVFIRMRYLRNRVL